MVFVWHRYTRGWVVNRQLTIALVGVCAEAVLVCLRRET